TLPALPPLPPLPPSPPSPPSPPVPAPPAPPTAPSPPLPTPPAPPLALPVFHAWLPTLLIVLPLTDASSLEMATIFVSHVWKFRFVVFCESHSAFAVLVPAAPAPPLPRASLLLSVRSDVRVLLLSRVFVLLSVAVLVYVLLSLLLLLSVLVLASW